MEGEISEENIVCLKGGNIIGRKFSRGPLYFFKRDMYFYLPGIIFVDPSKQIMFPSDIFSYPRKQVTWAVKLGLVLKYL